MKKQLIILFIFLTFFLYSQQSNEDFIFTQLKKSYRIEIKYSVKNKIITRWFDSNEYIITQKDSFLPDKSYNGIRLNIFTELPYYLCWDRYENYKILIPDETFNFKKYCYSDDLKFEIIEEKKYIEIKIFSDIELILKIYK